MWHPHLITNTPGETRKPHISLKRIPANAIPRPIKLTGTVFFEGPDRRPAELKVSDYGPLKEN